MKFLISSLFVFLFSLAPLSAQEQKEVSQSSPTAPAAAQKEAASENKEAQAADSSSVSLPQDGGARVIVHPSQVSLGVPFDIGVQLNSPASLDKEAFEKENQDFVILSQAPSKTPDTIKITAVPYALGVSTFTALSFKTKDGTVLTSAPFTVEITPVETGIKDEGIADIRGPFRPFNTASAALISVLIFILAALAVFIYKKFLRKKHLTRAAQVVSDDRPCDVIALEKIDNLLFGNIWANKEYKLFYINLVDIFRDFLSARFYFAADKYTSRDLLRRLKNIKNFTGDIAKIQEFQTSSDLVKFAKVIPSVEERDKDVASLRAIISSLKEQIASPIDQIALQKAPTAEEGAAPEPKAEEQPPRKKKKKGKRLP